MGWRMFRACLPGLSAAWRGVLSTVVATKKDCACPCVTLQAGRMGAVSAAVVETAAAACGCVTCCDSMAGWAHEMSHR
eukprot:498807-Amphidinium_carterae.1